MLSRKSLLALVMSVGIWQIATAANDAGTLLVGEAVSKQCFGVPLPWFYGYSNTIGSYSPTGLTGGKSVNGIIDTDFGNCSSPYAAVTVSGFSVNPGQSWLSSVTCGAVTNKGSGAIFTYDSGFATWKWTTVFGLKNHIGSNVSCAISHN